MTHQDTSIQAALDQGSEPQMREEWRRLLFSRFRDRPLPLLVSEYGTIPAASMWTGSRIWLGAFREIGLQPGDRIVVSLPPSPAFLQVLIAGIWQELTLAFVPETAVVENILQRVDARCVIALKKGPHTLVPNGVEGPGYPPPQLRSTIAPPTPLARFLLQTSGTTGAPRWIALSDRNILSVLHHHMDALNLNEARLLSVLPWNHAFGLIIDLLTALFSGAEIIRDAQAGRDPEAIVKLAKTWEATHLSAVPLTLKRLFETDAGRQLLLSLKGGVVGGAPVSPLLAHELAHTNLRVGYGQTEASPGICLGQPGQWRPNFLGKPLGCEVKVDENGELWFKGPNACYGRWDGESLEVLPYDRWVPSGDKVDEEPEGFVYRGRINDRFKLENGRMVEAGTWEILLKESIDPIEDALLYSDNGESLKLLIRSLEQHTTFIQHINECLGSLSKLIEEVAILPDNAWIRTRKGDIARDATIQSFASSKQKN